MRVKKRKVTRNENERGRREVRGRGSEGRTGIWMGQG